jgi:WD40 repeat protein
VLVRWACLLTRATPGPRRAAWRPGALKIPLSSLLPGGAARLSPDGENVRAFSIGSPLNSLYLWKYDPRRLKLEVTAPPWKAANVNKVTTAAFAPDGSTLVAAIDLAQDAGDAERAALKWFNCGDGKLNEVAQSDTKHPRSITAIAFAPDGRTMVTGCQGGSIQFWSQEAR